VKCMGIHRFSRSQSVTGVMLIRPGYDPATMEGNDVLRPCSLITRDSMDYVLK